MASFRCVDCIILMSVALLSGIEHCLGLPAVAELPATGAGARVLTGHGLRGAGVARPGLCLPPCTLDALIKGPGGHSACAQPRMYVLMHVSRSLVTTRVRQHCRA